MSHHQGAIDALFMALPAALSCAGARALGRGVFLRAHWHRDIKTRDLVCVQSFKPPADDLARQGVTLEGELPPKADFALYLATRQKEENRYNLARLWALLPEGGIVLAAQHNNFGAKSLEKDLKSLAGDVSVLTKFHSRAIWAVKSGATDAELLGQWLALGRPVTVAGSSLAAAPGMFSAQGIDAGSALLARSLPTDLAGVGADLGAGWGYLSHHVLSHCLAVTHLDLYEAEKLALDMAKANLSGFATKTAFYWVDLQVQGLKRRYDFIVCNPPMHQLDVQDIALGQKIVSGGLAALAPHGRMFIVANRHLPYEELIVAAKANFNVLVDTDGYKVLQVRR